LSGSDPIGKGKGKQHDNEKLKKQVHNTAGDLVFSQPQFKANKGFSNLDLDQMTHHRVPICRLPA
jgi:hypothetical protein